jgi:repressor LexA
MKEITERQGQILQYLCTYFAQHSYPPTVREIAGAFEISLRAVQEHLEALRKKKYIAWTEKRSRGIQIVDKSPEAEDPEATRRIPLVGSVAAGKPILCEENCDGSVPISLARLKKGKTYFALKVRGTSMIGAGILDGDIALIEQAPTAVDGQIVVAVLDDSATLKRFYKESARIRLQSENPDCKPIFCQDVRIAGVLSHIIREY